MMSWSSWLDIKYKQLNLSFSKVKPWLDGAVSIKLEHANESPNTTILVLYEKHLMKLLTYVIFFQKSLKEKLYKVAPSS